MHNFTLLIVSIINKFQYYSQTRLPKRNVRVQPAGTRREDFSISRRINNGSAFNITF